MYYNIFCYSYTKEQQEESIFLNLIEEIFTAVAGSDVQLDVILSNLATENKKKNDLVY